MRHVIVAIGVACAACQGTPKDAAGWARAATRRNRVQEKVEAVEQVRKAPGDKNDDYLYLGIDRTERRGNSSVTFDGKKVITATDDNFADAGKVGVWTKADSVTLFDDFSFGNK